MPGSCSGSFSTSHLVVTSLFSWNSLTDCAVGLKTDFNVPNLKSEEALDGQGGKLFLEELSFTVAKDEGLIRKLADTIGPLCLHQSVRERLKDQLVLISDDDMKHFALTGLQVNARNELDKRTKTSKNLWYEETIPADSLFTVSL